MNEQTLKLLTDLASKVGVTTEYLWGVLIKQGPISGFIDLVVIASWVVGLVMTNKFIKKNRDNWDDGLIVAAYVILCVGIAVLILIVGVCASDIISAIVHPEYWALEKLTSLIKLK